MLLLLWLWDLYDNNDVFTFVLFTMAAIITLSWSLLSLKSFHIQLQIIINNLNLCATFATCCYLRMLWKFQMFNAITTFNTWILLTDFRVKILILYPVKCIHFSLSVYVNNYMLHWHFHPLANRLRNVYECIHRW